MIPDRARVRLGVVVGLGLGLAGCAGHAEGGLAPTALRADATSRVDMLAVTTRAPTGLVDAPFDGDRGASVGIDRLVVSIPPEAKRTVGAVQWPSGRPTDPALGFAVLRSDAVELPAVASWFHRSGKHRVLVFVHGFDTRHDEAVFRFAQLVHDSGTDFLPVLFSWASRGSVWAYDYDKDSATVSRDALERVLRTAVADPGVTDVTVLAHSMGSWPAVEALRQMAIRDGGVSRKIGNVILASPDLDVDVFRAQLDRIGGHPRFTLFVSRDDHALELAKFVGGSGARLGAIDPFTPANRALLEKRGVDVVDLTALQGGGALNHDKFAKSPDVVRLLGERFLAGQPVSDAHVGLGDRLGVALVGTFGSVTTLVTAPVVAVTAGRP